MQSDHVHNPKIGDAQEHDPEELQIRPWSRKREKNLREYPIRISTAIEDMILLWVIRVEGHTHRLSKRQSPKGRTFARGVIACCV